MKRAVKLLTLDRRLIAFLDVLGFSSRMEQESPTAVVEHYSQFIHEANTRIFSGQNILNSEAPISNFAISRFVFDSIVLVSHPIDDPRNVSNFIFATSLLLERGLIEKLPLRGAISIGDYVESTEHGVFVSPIFKRLYAIEQQLEWSGCCILEDAIEIVLPCLYGSIVDPTAIQRNHPVVYSSIPIKKEAQKLFPPSLWCINWCHLLTDRELREGLEYLIGVKHENTLRFATQVHELPGIKRELVQGHEPPLYIRYLPSTTQCRIRFTDENDEPVEPKSPVSIGFDAEL